MSWRCPSGRGWLLALVFVGSCTVQKQVRVDFTETPRDYLPADYDGIYKRWTRHDYAQHDVDKSLEVWATYKSWDFREAYIARYAAVYNLSDGDRNKLRQAQLDAYREAYEFIVTAQSAKYEWNDLEKSSSPWRVALLDALGHELPAQRVRVEKLPDAYEREFFPAKTPFSKTYSIRFAMPPEGDFAGVRSGELTLRFDSPIGRLEVHWQS
ncbi:MAG TPA: hypothetical protein VLT58_02045 [Polyangia bacterium]|nr:hypothetical protein [Polyangia bacterium]